jgi:membrane carboxypeptidase/penicillin-binding protein PbpC
LSSTIQLKTDVRENVYWYLNDECLGVSAGTFLWHLKEGEHRLVACTEGGLQDKIRFKVNRLQP